MANVSLPGSNSSESFTSVGVPSGPAGRCSPAARSHQAAGLVWWQQPPRSRGAARPPAGAADCAPFGTHGTHLETKCSSSLLSYTVLTNVDMQEQTSLYAEKQWQSHHSSTKHMCAIADVISRWLERTQIGLAHSAS